MKSTGITVYWEIPLTDNFLIPLGPLRATWIDHGAAISGHLKPGPSGDPDPDKGQILPQNAGLSDFGLWKGMEPRHGSRNLQ
jgi:hypothetical protein